MTSEEEWVDPEIQSLLMDVKAAIDAYRHKEDFPSPGFNRRECKVFRRVSRVLAAPKPETGRQDKLSKSSA